MQKIVILLICIVFIALSVNVPVYAKNSDGDSYAVQSETDISEDSRESRDFNLKEILTAPVKQLNSSSLKKTTKVFHFIYGVYFRVRIKPRE